MGSNTDIAILEAILFAAGNPISTDDLASIFSKSKEETIAIVDKYQSVLAMRDSGLILRNTSSGYQLVTKPEFFTYVNKLGDVVKTTLSNAAMETLSIIAFKQPITRQEIEDIRGVKVERSLARLLEMDFINEVGRRQVLGRPILYGTTDVFLRAFGLNSLAELPKLPDNMDIIDELTIEERQMLEQGNSALHN